MSEKRNILWDIPTRLLHWVLALAVALNFLVLEEGEAAHRFFGFLAVAVVVLRLVYGLLARNHASLRNLPLRRADFIAFVKSFGADPDNRFPGHNPVASLVFLAVWFCILALGVTGYLSQTEMFWGEEWVEELHEACAGLLMFLVISHFLGMAHDSWRNRRRTFLGMITGQRG